ncbi:hypothetical protein [Neosynechococcus sphagnicola]|uniref:hypothetical protein n=1 Tax=Neosynechococcus sphagnicola TaxID=1501145 RepID=UPI00195546D2|nr:hypothetical protein [Neosynechococcus sphagnicola]
MAHPMFSETEPMTFEQAIAQTQALLEQVATETLAETELEAAIAQLVQSENGATGFFCHLSHQRVHLR